MVPKLPPVRVLSAIVIVMEVSGPETALTPQPELAPIFW